MATAQSSTPPAETLSALGDRVLAQRFVSEQSDAAFVELIRRYQIQVFRRLSVSLPDPDDAESLSQRVFVVASQRLEEWAGSEFRPWIMALADEVASQHQGDKPDENAPRFVDPTVFFKHAVHRALRGLPEPERVTLLAVELEKQPVEAVAEARGEPVEEVRKTLQRARELFTSALDESHDPEEADAPRPTEKVRPGQVIDRRYKVEELLGEGGMAAVFRAEHLNIKRKVAVKTLHPTRQAQAMMKERFVREAEVLGRLAHPNFVDVSDFGENRHGMAYLVMELLDGHPLSTEITQHGRLSPERALRIVREVCAGLAFAHAQGIVHRDIKPDNIVILEEEHGPGFAKILDLGIATSDGQAAKEDKALYGTPAYMAPEQIVGGRVDGRADLYALGVVLFELVTGKRPFQGRTLQYLLAQHVTAAPPALTEVHPELEHAEVLAAIVSRCLKKQAEERYPNASVMLKAIDEAILECGGSGAGEKKWGKRRTSLRARGGEGTAMEEGRRFGVWILWGLVAVLLGVVVWWTLGW